MHASSTRLLVAVLAASLAGCSEAPMAYLHTAGPAADPVTTLGWGLGLLCAAIVLVIGVLLLLAIGRKPLREGDPASLTLARTGNGLAWIQVGVAVSSLLLLGIVVWVFTTLDAVARPKVAPAFTIEIRAHQWWWEIRYRDDVASHTFTTANELHIPVGRPVALRLIGDDVIHSFWIPALAGKTDVIPGQTNEAWIQADRPGVYRGQCAEFCGLQHAHMSAFVAADPPDAFQHWWSAQLAQASVAKSAPEIAGRAVFVARCAACHAVRGTSTGGIVGPDLTHLMSRQTLGAGALPNNPKALWGWIADPQASKPGNRMPRIDLSAAELDVLTAYLQTLR